MAMYKDTEINASLIQDKFPAVAASIIAGANSGEQNITLDSIRDSHPDIVASLQAEGAESSGHDSGAAVTAERERVLAIQALTQPGYETVISEAVADSKMTPDQVKMSLFDAMQTKKAETLTQHKEDGKKLGSTLAELSGGSEEGGEQSLSDDEKSGASMEAAGQKARGES